jgi:hypothetical protein
VVANLLLLAFLALLLCSLSSKSLLPLLLLVGFAER